MQTFTTALKTIDAGITSVVIEACAAEGETIAATR